MVFRISLSILFCIIGILASKAQLSRRDSIRLKQLLEGDKEIKLNQEAVKSIQFCLQNWSAEAGRVWC